MPAPWRTSHGASIARSPPANGSSRRGSSPRSRRPGPSPTSRPTSRIVSASPAARKIAPSPRRRTWALPHNPMGPVAGAVALNFDVATTNFVIQEEAVGIVPWFEEISARSIRSSSSTAAGRCPKSQASASRSTRRRPRSTVPAEVIPAMASVLRMGGSPTGERLLPQSSSGRRPARGRGPRMPTLHGADAASTASRPTRGRPRCASPTCASPRSPVRPSGRHSSRSTRTRGSRVWRECVTGRAPPIADAQEPAAWRKPLRHRRLLFRRIKHPAATVVRAAACSAVEIALWDLAGKAYGVADLPDAWRQVPRQGAHVQRHGRRETERPGNRSTAQGSHGARLHLSQDDLGLKQIAHLPAPWRGHRACWKRSAPAPHEARAQTLDERRTRNAAYDAQNVPHPFTGLHFTERGLDYLEQYIAEVREVIGPEIPLAIDHLGHISLQNGIRLRSGSRNTRQPGWRT